MLTPALLALDSHRAFADRLPSLAQEAQRKAMANLPATAYTTPTASPASQRSMRSAGTAGKPSPESAAEMGAPPTPKRRQPSSRQPPARGDPPSRGAKQQAATGAQPPPSNSSMPPPPPRAPSNAWKSGQGWIGRKQQAAARDVTASSAGAADDRMDISFPLLAPRPANLLIAANAAASSLAYSSPRTDPQLRREPAVTRAAQAEGRGDVKAAPPSLQERLDALAPHGRVQRREWLSEHQKHELKMALQRERRAQAKRLQAACGVLMLELGRYDLPLVQLQLAEFAAEPSNLAVAASMRWRFLDLFGQCCHTKHTDSIEFVLELPVLAAVLKRFKPARDLLHVRLVAAKQILAESFTGAHRMGRVNPSSYKTLTEMRIKLFAEQRRDGATAKDLVGSGSFMPKLSSRAGTCRRSLWQTRHHRLLCRKIM